MDDETTGRAINNYCEVTECVCGTCAFYVAASPEMGECNEGPPHTIALLFPAAGGAPGGIVLPGQNGHPAKHHVQVNALSPPVAATRPGCARYVPVDALEDGE